MHSKQMLTKLSDDLSVHLLNDDKRALDFKWCAYADSETTEMSLWANKRTNEWTSKRTYTTTKEIFEFVFDSQRTVDDGKPLPVAFSHSQTVHWLTQSWSKLSRHQCQWFCFSFFVIKLWIFFFVFKFDEEQKQKKTQELFQKSRKRQWVIFEGRNWTKSNEIVHWKL